MKSRSALLFPGLSIVLTISAVSSASSQITGNWNVNAAGSWGTAGNWLSTPADSIPGTTLAGGDSASLDFNINAARIITLDGERHLGSLTIGDPDSSHAYTLNAGTGGRINFNSASAAPATLTYTSNNPTNIGAPITLTTDLRAMDLGTALATRTLSGIISGPGAITFDNDDGITPIDQVQQVGAFVLSGTNTFSGGITIKDVRVGTGGNSSGFGTGTIKVLPGGSAHLTPSVTVSNDMELSGEGWLENIGRLGALRLASGTTASGTLTITGTPGDSAGTLPDASLGTFAISNGAVSATVNGVVTGGDLLVGTFSAGQAGFTGNETLTMNNANTHGDTIVSGYSSNLTGQTLLSIGNGPANTTATLGTGNVYLHGGAAGRTVALRIWRGGGYTLAQDIITMSSPTTTTAFLADVTGDGLTTNGRSITVTEQIRLGGSANSAVLNIDAETQITAGQFFTGNATGNSTTVNQTGGTVTVSGEVRIAHFVNETSVWNLSGGTLDLTGLPTANPFTTGATEAADGPGTLYIGINGEGFFNQTGGTVNAAAVVLDNRGNSNAGTNMPTGIDTYLLAGGTLNLGSGETGGDWGISGNSTTSFEFAGGTLNLGTSLPISVPVAITGTGSVFDTKTHTATISGPLSGSGILELKDAAGSVVLDSSDSSTIGGFSGDAPLQKSGTGSLTITGSSPRTGTNLISAGELSVLGTLGGNTAIEGATLRTGGTINGDLTLAATATLAVSFDSSAETPSADQLIVTAAVSLAGATLALSDVATTPAPIPGGTKFTIIAPAGAASGTFAGIVNGGVITASGGQKFIVRYNDGGMVTLEATSGTASPYDTWAASFGLDPLTNGAPGEDHDRDGIPNGIEFIIGGNPTTNSNPLPGRPMSQIVGNNLVFTFQRSEASKAFEVRVDTSTDLASWPPADSYLIPTVATAGTPVTVIDNSPATADEVTVTIPMGADPKKFARLRLVIP